MVWNHKIVIRNLLVEFFVVFASVGEAAAEEGEEENSSGVYVRRRPAELDLFDDFRSHVGRCAAEKFDLLRVRDLSAEAEIDEFDVAPVVQHHVLQLDVTVRDAFRVKIVECADELRKYFLRLVLFHLPIRLALQETVS